MKGWMGKIKALALLSSLALFLSGCGKDNLTALVPKGYGSEVSFNLIILTTVVMTFVFLAVIITYVIVLLRFRKKKGQEDFIPKQVEGNQTLETIWTVIPIILVIIMAVPTVIHSFTLSDTSEADEHINIDVTGNQYWWHFDYKDEGFQTSQDLYIPQGERVYLNMIASDVTHSFWVPSISGKMDVNVDNENTMYIEAYEEGVYWGKCAELCGPSHSLMDFKVIVVSPEEYDQWIADMKDVDPEAEPESAVAQEGKELFEENNCMGCHAIGSSPAQVGPNLTNFGDRTKFAGFLDPTKENLVDWIMDPESIKPGNKMTGNYPDLSEDEADKIAEYLMQLQPSEVTPDSAGGLK
ncbi:cytochrome c oxidase subunit II [Virgibacillus alimentarius]|uniref:Cytochrome c oxidase subunit 2 n=1 Tax=Virgibacillus alimentarius TaxID=698769 RepID=A0ABS4S3L7_9BACI|nr:MULTISPECIES: cytochrome c oxidase subunit II [Virgibacillus]MBP2256080.1 cytochrome c oxidase subunit 2 [Virgibacillus alimentarius]HLR66027.1 cytochrome c oxidase subunit II [Virgibacillus sp.]